MTNTETLSPYPMSAWEMNKWPEYPEVRYWSDLAYHPARRPFYPFVRPALLAKTSASSQRVVVQYCGSHTRQKASSRRRAESIETDKRWQETQEYWWNVVDGPQTKDTNEEEQRRQNDAPISEKSSDQEAEYLPQKSPASFKTIVAGARRFLHPVPSILNLFHIAQNHFGVALAVIDWIFPHCLHISWAVLLGGVLFAVVHGFIWK
ncbi:hypothetical protein PFICI_14954 [Pestalotiopsis fici W106-1]|uniref:Uncharacterized protein n=1 Tax=Pestalotiopsis fici (strain W106-1 / CGMCC3.15140) TaxID=1229662 RepID=W3WHU6_PESFW|nr:uncharacterized protein PFICI_14954 [Pestalotiopsis fici W106-1]ETS73349.1 hypothetical protein PFICI_14954 [Pestalotiopsis fici W106-1]